MTNLEPNANENYARFSSFEALRITHTELLKEFRAQRSNPEIIAKIEEFIKRGRATGVLLDGEDERGIAQSQLDYWTTQLYRPDYEPPDATLEDYDPAQAPELEGKLCPYMGLNAFQETNENIFFGREDLISESIGKLQVMRFLAIVGSSGSGKSSLVRAGIIPKLKAGELPESNSWLYFPPIVPGSKPLLNLARLLAKYYDSSAEPEKEAEFYQQDGNYLTNLISEQLKKNVVIIVDQFEEIFTLCTDKSERHAFVQNLINLCKIPNAEHRVIITLRSDFESNIALLPELQSILEPAAVRLTPLSVSDLRKAIEEPATPIGLKFEDGVVDALLNDTLGDPAALPLLQFTLLKLWENREKNRITMAAYRELGGGRKALEHTAEELYTQLTHEDQVALRRILLKLVKPTEGLEITSSRIPVALLYRRGEASDRISRVLGKLIEFHLVRISQGDVTIDDQVEVAHEALVRNWRRLVEWLEDERTSLRQRHRLTLAAEEWEQLGRVPSALWDGERLLQARQYDDLSAQENEFIEASYGAEHSKEEKKYRRLILGWVILATVIGSILGGIILVYSIQYFGKEARESKAIAATQVVQIETQAATIKNIQATNTSLVATAINAETLQDKIILANRLTQQAQSLIVRDGPDRMAAFLLAIYSRSLYSTADSSQILIDSKFAYPEWQLFQGNSVYYAAFDSSGQYALTGSSNNIWIWDVNTGKPIEQVKPNGFLSSAVFSPNTQFVVAGLCEKTSGDVCTTGAIDVLDVKTGKEIWKMNHGDFVSSVAISSNSEYIVSGGCDDLQSNGNCIQGTARIWEFKSGQEIARMVHNGSVETVSFSPDGNYIVSGGSDKTVHVWDAFTGREITRMMHDGTVESVSFSPNGRYVVSGGCDKVNAESFCIEGSARVWDAFTGQEIARKIHGGTVESVSFSPDGRYVASGSFDNTVLVWDFLTDKEILRISQDGSVFSVAFSPDGKYLILGSNSQSVQVWEIATGKESTQMVHNGNVTSVAFSPDGKRAISAGADGIVYIWLYNRDDITQKMVDSCSLATRNLTPNEWSQYVGNQPYQEICPNLRFDPNATPTP